MSDRLAEQTVFESEIFKKLTLADHRLEGKEFIACTFSKCSFKEANFSYCIFRDCTFSECDLSLAHLPGCTFIQVKFEKSQLMGINWTETTWAQAKRIFKKPVDFIGCNLNYAIFMGLNLKGVAVRGCTARSADFSEADLTHADCTQTDFESSRFSHTNLTAADFTGARNYSLSPVENTLKKTRFSLPEAMALLHGLDIVLTEYEEEL